MCQPGRGRAAAGKTTQTLNNCGLIVDNVHGVTEINVKKTVVCTHFNGDSHSENR